MSDRRDVLAAGLPLALSVVVAVGALALSVVIIALTGYAPGDVVPAFIDGAFGGSEQAAATIMVTLPLTLLGLAWVVASSARQINLGLEGQVVAGGIGATIVGTNLEGLVQPLHLALAVLAGAACGAAWAAIPALMYVRRDVSVLLSTFMLNFVAVLLVAWLVRGPLRNPAGLGLIESEPVLASATWPVIGTSGLRWDVVLIVVGVALLVFVQRRTTMGFRLRLISANEEAARHAGIATKRVGAAALLTSGGIAGLVGSSLILGSFTGTMTEGFSSGYGFIGIAVALLARNSPVGCVAAALLFATLQQGGALLETRVGVPSASVELTQGFVILLIAASAWMLPHTGRRRATRAPMPEGFDGAV